MSKEVEEAEANYFAMCLLMPEQMVRAEVKQMGGIDLTDDRGIRTLARKFEVSVPMMVLRLAQLKCTSV